MFSKIIATAFVGGASAIAFAAAASASTGAQGIWYDHEGRGAVEIRPCASNKSRLCGYVVYVKKAKNKKRCGLQIIGNVKSNGWGWIYSPKRGRSFPLKMKKLSNDRLRIVGNAGSRFFSKTFTWKRAPDSVVNCEQAAKPIEAKASAKPAAETSASIEPAGTASKPAPVSRSNKEDATSGQTGTRSERSATTALIAKPKPKTAAAAETTQGKQQTAVASEAGDRDTVKTQAAAEDEQAGGIEEDDTAENDLAPPGGISRPKLSMSDIEGKIRKFVKAGGSKKKCNFRIPHVGRTIKVPCK